MRIWTYISIFPGAQKEHNPEGNVSEDDARKVVLLEHIIRFFERKIVEIVKFAKCVPGFKDLCMDDQAALIKGKSKH